jgi:hypothetical protein
VGGAGKLWQLAADLTGKEDASRVAALNTDNAGELFMATAAAKPGVTPARPKPGDKKSGKDKAPTFPSDFGSHTSMLNAELNEKIVADKQNAGDPWAILKDERGDYATRRSRLDTGMADPFRFADQTIRDQQLKDLTTA